MAHRVCKVDDVPKHGDVPWQTVTNDQRDPDVKCSNHVTTCAFPFVQTIHS